jgi:hypothetical protein
MFFRENLEACNARLPNTIVVEFSVLLNRLDESLRGCDIMSRPKIQTISRGKRFRMRGPRVLGNVRHIAKRFL